MLNFSNKLVEFLVEKKLKFYKYRLIIIKQNFNFFF